MSSLRVNEELTQDLCATLTVTRRQFDQALQITVLAAVIPRAVRTELSVMRDDLDRIITEPENARTSNRDSISVMSD